MNRLASSQSGKRIFAPKSSASENPVLLVAADTARFCLLEELRSDGLRGKTCAELATDSVVMVIFSPGRSAAAVVTACERGLLSLQFRQPVDVDAILDSAALAAGGGGQRLPPIRVDRQVEILRQGQSIMTGLQDISSRAARLESTELCPGDEITVCMGNQVRRKAKVKWTQGGIAGITFSPTIPFAELANWIVEQQFGAPFARNGAARMSLTTCAYSHVVDRLLVIDPDFRRRAAVCHALGDMPLHVEPFSDVSELAEFRTEGALVLVHDNGKAIPAFTNWIETTGHWLPAVAYSEASRAALIVDAIKRGALDYLTWPFTPALVTDTLERIAPEVEEKSDAMRRKRHAVTQLSRLSDRERQILKAMICGHSNRQIADLTGLSVRTVETHRANVLRKMGADHSSEAIRLGLEAGLA